MKPVSISHGRGPLVWLGAIYESTAEASDARVYPPPGKLVDVHGYRLHINCTGTGGPTVVIDAGQRAVTILKLNSQKPRLLRL